MARPDGLEPPTTWFEARYSFLQFSAQPCRLLYIGVPTDFGVMGSETPVTATYGQLLWEDNGTTFVGLFL